MRFSIEYVKPGMIVGNPVINNNSMIINSNVVLTERIIEGLKKNGIKYIDINLTQEQEDALEADKGVQTTISQQLKEDSKSSIKNFNTAEIIKNAQLMTTSIIESNDFRYSLSEYKQVADIFSHSVRTASFAILLAKFYNDSIDSSENKIDLQSIAVATMLHDIGKLCENKDILDKVLETPTVLSQIYPAVNDFVLSEYNDKYSSIYSYLLLSQNHSLKNDIKMMVLLSNENENGQGSLQLGEKYTKSKQSFVMGSKIIRLCSMYDDELKQSIDENTPLENISSKLDFYATNNIINEDLEKLFIEHVPLYSKGVKVRLSDGRYAVVEESFHGRLFICKPIVKTIDGEIIDLRNITNLTIQEICSDEISFFEIVNKQIESMEQEISIDTKNKSF